MTCAGRIPCRTPGRPIPGLLIPIAAALTPSAAVAQQPAAEDLGAEAIEEIVVTGSRIKRRDYTSASPLTTVDRQTIAFSAQPSVEETLNQMPQITPDLGRTSNNPGDGTARINLRGFGAGRTLVMLNGRRLAPSGVGSAVDVNNLPQVLIDRIEIITGGATTVYGSDAVAGVVNFITRDNFTGLNIEASATATGEGDAEVYDANLVWGFGLGRSGNVTVYAGTLERKALLAGARELTRVVFENDDATGTLVEAGSPLTPEGVIFAPSVDFGPGRPWTTFDAAGDPRQFLDPEDRYNFAPVNYLQTPLSRNYAGLMGSVGLGGDYELYFESQFSHNEARQQLAPVPAFTFAEVATASPFLSPAAQQFFADNYEVAPGLSVVGVGRRLLEVGPRIIDNERDYWRTVLGIRGEFGGGWEMDGWLSYTEAEENAFFLNDASVSRLVQGMLVDPVSGECVDPSGGCVPVDVFGPDQLSAEGASFIRIDGLENVTSRTQTLASGFARGTLLEGWAGPIDAAFGLEWRSDDASFAADDLFFTGDTLGFNGAAPIAGREDVVEVYVEALIPLAQGAAWADYAALEIGGRYSDYDNAGGVHTWKLGGEWQPVGSVRFRAMRQQSVRAPNNAELFTEQFSQTSAGGVITGFDDPCSASADPVASGNAEKCIIQGLPEDQLGVFEATGVPIEFVFGGNTALIPETANTWTIGAVLTPGWLPSWTFTVDYFDLEVDDSIGEPQPFNICFDPQNTANLFCENLRRDPVSGNLIQLFRTFSNLGTISTRGVDVLANYQVQLPPWLELGEQAATLTVGATWSHVIEYGWQLSPVSEFVDCTGLFGAFCSRAIDAASFGAIPENRVTTNVGYSSGQVTVHLTSRWIDGTKNVAITEARFLQRPVPILAIPEIGSRHYLNLGVGWHITDDMVIRLGVENLTDTEAPNMADAASQNNTDAQLFDVFGRTYYVSFAARFFGQGSAP